MSTNASITYFDENRQVYRSIYLHWDGYIDGAGVKLVDGYKSPWEVEELINRGDMSELSKNKNKNVHYHEWRNEPWEHTKPREYTDIKEVFRNEIQHYMYFFVLNEWYYLNKETMELEKIKNK